MTFRAFLKAVLFSQFFMLYGQSVSDNDSAHTESIVPASSQQVILPPKKYNFFVSLGENMSEQFYAPFSMTKDQALMFGAGVVITGTLIYFDQDIDNVVSPWSRNNAFIRQTSPHITELGGSTGLYAVGAFGIYSLIWNDTKAQRTTILLSEALITSGLWVRLGKMIFSRERPSAAYEFSRKSGGRWHRADGFFAQSFQSVAQHDAFPSGHTATAFSMAAVIAEEYGDNSYVAPIVYTLATTVAVTRLIEHTHWASDVFLGGIIGYLCGKQVVHHYHDNYGVNNGETSISLGMIDEAPALKVEVKF